MTQVESGSGRTFNVVLRIVEPSKAALTDTSAGHSSKYYRLRVSSLIGPLVQRGVAWAEPSWFPLGVEPR